MSLLSSLNQDRGLFLKTEVNELYSDEQKMKRIESCLKLHNTISSILVACKIKLVNYNQTFLNIIEF